MDTQQLQLASSPNPQEGYLLRLPMELLEDIGSFCDPQADTLALRLACRSLAAAALRPFLDHYIITIECCMVKHSSVQNVYNIFKTPYLLEKVQTLALTMKEDISDHKAHGGRCLELDDRCQCGTKTMAAESWPLIQDMIRSVGQQSNGSIIVDFAWERYTCTRIRPAPQASTLLREILASARSANCPISELEMSDRFDVNFADYLPLGTQDPALVHLQAFAYVLNPYKKEEDLQSPNIMQQSDIVRAVNHHAHRLEHFGVAVHPWRGGSMQPLIALSRELLSGPPFSVLQSATLTRLRARQQILLDFFDRCPSTLKYVEVTCVGLYDGGDVWTDVFRCLQKFDSLRRIHISQICITVGHRGRHVKFIVPEMSTNERRGEMYGIKNVDPRRFLGTNIEKGLVYSRVFEPEPLSAPSSLIP